MTTMVLSSLRGVQYPTVPGPTYGWCPAPSARVRNHGVTPDDTGTYGCPRTSPPVGKVSSPTCLYEGRWKTSTPRHTRRNLREDPSALSGARQPPTSEVRISRTGPRVDPSLGPRGVLQDPQWSSYDLYSNAEGCMYVRVYVFVYVYIFV